MKKILIGLVILPLFLLSNEITLGVVPQQSPLKLAKKWLQITEYLNQKTGLNIVFKTEKSIPLFEEKLYAGVYDIAYMNPYHFIVANSTQKYSAFIRAKKNIVGIIVANDKKTFDFNSLKNKTFLFPAPNAFAATLLPKYELKNKYNFDIDKEAKVLYVNSHDSVYKGVSRQIGDFGGGIMRTYNNFLDKNDKDRINIVYKTSPYPSHPFASNPRISKDVIEKLTNAFLTMPSELKELLSIKEFKVTNTEEFNVIRELEVKK